MGVQAGRPPRRVRHEFSLERRLAWIKTIDSMAAPSR